MANAANILHSLVPISQFNKGKAAQIFDRLRTEKELVVLKNNQPSAVILSPEEYTRLTEIEKDYMLLLEAKMWRKWKSNDLVVQEGDYGKPLGNKTGNNLTNLLKIKFRNLGIRVVYKTIQVDGIMKIIVISARTDEQVYKEAGKRREKYDL